jgi:hypothetical protein
MYIANIKEETHTANIKEETHPVLLYGPLAETGKGAWAASAASEGWPLRGYPHGRQTVPCGQPEHSSFVFLQGLVLSKVSAASISCRCNRRYTPAPALAGPDPLQLGAARPSPAGCNRR